jgi:crotonobetainyl-CoA:carnitine CoA-transferase CaiB-like acyl-CoA transferase
MRPSEAGLNQTAPTHPKDLLELRRTLAPVLGSDQDSRGFWQGARHWWSGPLDVEALALGAVGAVIAAADALVAGADPREQLGTSGDLVAAAFNAIGHLRVNEVPPVAWAPMSGFYPTGDGWIRVHANYPHHADAIYRALDISEPGLLARALEDVPGRTAEDTIVAAGGVAAVVVRPDPGRLRDPADWIEFALEVAPRGRGDLHRARAGSRSVTRPLQGVRVLDLTRVLAGPTGASILGALGADVLRVDPPHVPELIDAHVATGFDKRSGTADLRVPSDLAVVRGLIQDADIVFAGYRPGALSSFGLDPTELRHDFPGVQVVSLSAWEPDGRRAGQRGFDSIVQAASGISSVYGGSSPGSGWRPGSLPVQALDYATGFGMAAAAMGLLVAGKRGLVGSARLSLERTAALLLSTHVGSSATAHPQPVPTRHTRSVFGAIEYVPPPFTRGQRQLDFRHPPQAYGGSPLEWLA